MKIREITDNIFYVGVNDRTTTRFENLWPLPYGVSYNSYLVKGTDKIALIDCVEQASMPDFIGKIRSVIGDKKVDYLVVNHMEPDHSGGIPELIRLFPEIKIVCNRLSSGMLNGYYNLSSDRIHEIKDNDSLALGSATLRFLMTPMVHWPETMMTYLEEKKVLFSGDGFGCFGALNGGIVDNEMATDIYIEEMYRYYSNIVAKFGKFVQNALNKTKGLPIEYLCTLHGPVWHDRISEVVGIYDRLSRYEGEDGITLIYGSMYGNTSLLAEAIASRLSERGIKNIRIHNASYSDMSYMISDALRYKGLIVGSPTYCMTLYPPVAAFLEAMATRELKGRITATFGSYTWASAAVGKLNEWFTNMKMPQVASLEMKMAPTEEDFQSARDFADKIVDALK